MSRITRKKRVESHLNTMRPSVLRRMMRVVERGLAILGLLLLLYLAGFDLSRMHSNSMAPTLQGRGGPKSDWVLTERISFAFRPPHRWELMAFRNRDGVQVMKRVIGLPHETVALKKNGIFLIDGEPVMRPEELGDIKYHPYGRLTMGNRARADDGFFVLGDDSGDSQDSRFEPPVKRDQVIGRPWLIVWPPSRLGFVNP